MTKAPTKKAGAKPTRKSPGKSSAKSAGKATSKAANKPVAKTVRKTGGDSTVLVKTRIRTSQAATVLILLTLLFLAPLWGRDGLFSELLRWIGYFALIAGVLGRVWCSAYIGGRKSQIVVDVGPYSITRNPLYVFSFIGLVGVGLTTGMAVVALVLAVAFMIYYRRVVAGEETFLTQRHDAEFEQYLQRVPRWLPDLRLYREATEPMGLPRNVLITIVESSAFFLAPPLFALVGWLQALDILPVLIRLP